MHLGLCLPQLGGHVDGDGLRAFCEQADELGCGSLWVQAGCSPRRRGSNQLPGNPR
jgi:hypothetical protein